MDVDDGQRPTIGERVLGDEERPLEAEGPRRHRADGRTLQRMDGSSDMNGGARWGQSVSQSARYQSGRQGRRPSLMPASSPLPAVRRPTCRRHKHHPVLVHQLLGKADKALVDDLRKKLRIPSRYRAFLTAADPVKVETVTPVERVRLLPHASVVHPGVSSRG